MMREVAVTELALDDDQRHALVGHLDRMRVAELVGREATTHARLGGEPAELEPDGWCCPRPAACWSIDHAEERPDRDRGALVKPRPQSLPAPVIHADLAAAAALAFSHK